MNSLNHPSGWVWTSIGEILNVVRGGSPRPKGDPRYFGGKIPWIMIADVTAEKGKYISKTRDSVTEEGAKKSRLLPKGTLILTNSATVCVPKILAVDGCIHDGFVAFPELSKNLNILYIFYYFDYIRPQIIQQNRQGITQVNLNIEIVKNIPILLPPIPEQYRIVTKIEELFTQLDAGVASLKKVQAQLKRYRQAVLKAAFEGRLTQEWRDEHKGKIEQASVLFERIKSEYNHDEKEITKRLPLDEAELFQLPEEWIWIQAQDVCENITNGYTPTADKLFQDSGEIPFIKVYNLTKTGALNFTVKPTFISKVTHETELRRSAVYPQDVLMNIVGPPLGKVSLVPELYPEWNINQAMVIYRTFPEYSRKLMLYALLSQTIQKWLQKRGKTTAGQTNYTITMSRSLPIPLPPLNEQSLIVNEIERHFSQIDHLELTITTSLRQADTLRQSILKRAFGGKLVPQNPNDEPASILLERIKAEKARHTAEVKKGKTLQPKSPKRKIKNAN